jgi:hypothetical protein
VLGIVEGVAGGLEEAVGLALHIPREHADVAGIEPGIDDTADVPGTKRRLEIECEGFAVLSQLFADGGDAVGVPSYGGVGSAEGLDPAIGELADGLCAQEFVQKGRGAKVAAVAATERSE